MTAPVCAVTGANGFVGKVITRRFQMLGQRVIALVRKPEQAPVGTEARQFILGDPVAPHLLDKIDILLHAAYDFSLYGWSDICRVNVVGSEYLFDRQSGQALSGRFLFRAWRHSKAAGRITAAASWLSKIPFAPAAELLSARA